MKTCSILSIRAMMRLTAISMLALCTLAPVRSLAATDTLRAIVLLSPECPICKNYMPVLNEIAATYRGKLTMIGLFPGKAYTDADIDSFRMEYHVAYRFQKDPVFKLCKKLHATTTPEVFLLDEHESVLYSGLIDNWASSLGVHRPEVTEHYLIDAIDRALQHAPVRVRKTQAIGCFINSK